MRWECWKKAQDNDDINDELTNKRIEETYDHDLPSRGSKHSARARTNKQQQQKNNNNNRAMSVCVCASDFSLFVCRQFRFNEQATLVTSDELHLHNRNNWNEKGRREKKGQKKIHRHKNATTSISNINICALQKWENIFYNANNTSIALAIGTSQKKHRPKRKKIAKKKKEKKSRA